MRKGLNISFYRKVRPDTKKAASDPSHHPGGGPPPDHGGHRRGRQEAEGEKPLSQCRAGDLIFVRRIVGRGPVRRRLLEMGMNPGTQVRVVKYAPLKDPIECEIKGYHIALRVAEAQSVIVAPQGL